MSDFSLEKRLKDEAPHLHELVSDSLVALQGILDAFYTWFPAFTDHSILHSMNVLDFCNQLIGDQVWKLSIPECYVLVMACYLHDIGMSITREHFELLTTQIDLTDYRRKFPDADIATTIRDFHHEYSGLLIRRNADLFDIPSETLVFAITQVSRGHRKMDLYDNKNYPDIESQDGIIRTAFLSAMLRLADEIDVGVCRIPELLQDSSKLTKQKDIDIFGTHESIHKVEVTENAIILYTKPKKPQYEGMVEDMAKKIQTTLDYCREVAAKRSELHITQTRVEIIKRGDDIAVPKGL